MHESKATAKNGAAAARPLRVVRVARNFSQARLARASGLSPSTISRLENGHEQPYRLTRERLAEVLDYPVGELFPENEKGVSRPN